MTTKTRISFYIPGKVQSLNELLGMDPFSYNAAKKMWAFRVNRALERFKIPAFKAAKLDYTFEEPTRRRDPSNFVSAAIKFIEDALVQFSVLPDDGWDEVLGISLSWEKKEGREGVTVTLEGETFDEPRERIYKRKLAEEAKKRVEREVTARERAVGFAKRPKPLRQAGRPRGKAAGARLPGKRRKG